MGTRLRSSTRASTVASESLAETMSEIKGSKGDTKKSSSSGFNQQRPLRKDELIKLRKVAGAAILLANLAIGGLIYACLNDQIRLYPASFKPESLTGFTSRAEYALRYQTLLLAWLMFNIIAVMKVRLTKKAINPLVDSTEKHTIEIKNILTNSYEQITLSILSQLAFVSFATPAMTLKLIPLANFVQFFGRICFFFGYPMYRTFGFSLSLTPNMLLVGYNLYRLGQFYKLY